MNEEKLEELKNWCAEKNWVLHVVEKGTDRNKVVKGPSHVYGLIADGKVELLGEGTQDRSNLMFPGYSVQGHLRAISMACLYHSAKAITRFVVVPESGYFSKKEAGKCEDYLHDKTGFKDEELEAKNKRICDYRINQLIAEGEITRDDVDSVAYKVCMYFIQYATGTDARTYRNLVKKYAVDDFKDFPEVAGASATIKKIINGYYTNI